MTALGFKKTEFQAFFRGVYYPSVLNRSANFASVNPWEFSASRIRYISSCI
jgi:hypothetical protein